MGAALLLSIISAFYSIVGLASIFSGAFWAIIVLGITLEICKVSSVSWLSSHWNIAPLSLKFYLVPAVITLMLITSMGTFGYLSKAHLAQSAQINQSQFQIQPLEYQLKLEESRLRNAQTSLDTLDRFANNADPKDAVFIRNRQRSERQHIDSEISNANGRLEDLNAKLLPLRTTQQAAEAEIGPLKYISELLYGKDAASHFDDAVRAVIILIVIVFDPLAIILLIAANFGLAFKVKRKYNGNKSKVFEIGRDEILKNYDKKTKKVTLNKNEILNL
jgi:hypothetical protein